MEITQGHRTSSYKLEIAVQHSRVRSRIYVFRDYATFDLDSDSKLHRYELSENLHPFATAGTIIHLIESSPYMFYTTKG